MDFAVLYAYVTCLTKLVSVWLTVNYARKVLPTACHIMPPPQKHGLHPRGHCYVRAIRQYDLCKTSFLPHCLVILICLTLAYTCRTILFLFCISCLCIIVRVFMYSIWYLRRYPELWTHIFNSHSHLNM